LKILIVHNEYGAISGEEVMINHVVDLLASRGHTVARYTRYSQEIESKQFGKTRALFSGIYGVTARRELRDTLKSFAPDAVVVKNLFPLISPAVLPIISKMGIPALMLVSNYRLTCPNGLHLSHGQICEKCTGGHEYHCVLKNCEGNFPKSFGYALRSFIARRAGWYEDHVSAFLCASTFLRDKLIRAGFQGSRIHIVPNFVPDRVTDDLARKPPSGCNYVAYAGRLSREKGIPTVLKAAALCPEIEFRLAGRVNMPQEILSAAPANVKFMGFLNGSELTEFLLNARMVISASECYETFGMTVAEAMLCSRPVVVSRIGVFPEFVAENVTGVLFEPGNAPDLARQIQALWAQPELCTQLGIAGRKHALSTYCDDRYYAGIMSVLERIVGASRTGANRPMPVPQTQ